MRKLPPPPVRKAAPTPEADPDRHTDAHKATPQERTWPLIQAFVKALHGEDCWDRLSKSEQGRIRGAVGNLPDDATPEQVRQKTAVYAKDNPDLTITATAVVANWSSIGRQHGRDIDSGKQRYNDPVTAELATTEPQQYTRDDGIEVTYVRRTVDGDLAPIEGWTLTEGVHRYRRLDDGTWIEPTGEVDDLGLVFAAMDDDQHRTDDGWSKPSAEVREAIAAKLKGIGA